MAILTVPHQKPKKAVPHHDGMDESIQRSGYTKSLVQVELC